MSAQRITGIMNGEITALGAGPPMLSSVNSQWSGFLLEEHAIAAPREEIAWSWHSTHVGICTAGSSAIHISGAAGNLDYVARPGSICIFPRGCDQTTILHAGGGYRFVVVELDVARIERLLPDENVADQRALMAQINVNDRQIVALIGNMRAEIKTGCRAGPLYHESLSLALTTYLSNRYAGQTPATAVSGTRFSPVQRRRVLDYIQAHLSTEFSLLELAGVLDLGPRHFSRLFRNTFGTTPYHYLVSERIHQARILLAIRRLSIAEIAETLGFASQSHFTDTFQKAIGVPPGRYRQQH